MVVIYLVCLLFRVQTSITLFSIVEFPQESQCIAKQIALFPTNTFSAFDPSRIKLCFLVVWPWTTAQNLSMWPESRLTSILSTEMNGPLAQCNFFTSHALPLQQSLSQQIPNHLRYVGLQACQEPLSLSQLKVVL